MSVLCPVEPNFNKFHNALNGSTFLFAEMFHIQLKNIFKFLDFRDRVKNCKFDSLGNSLNLFHNVHLIDSAKLEDCTSIHGSHMIFTETALNSFASPNIVHTSISTITGYIYKNPILNTHFMATNYSHSTGPKLLLLHVVISKHLDRLFCGTGLAPVTVSRVSHIYSRPYSAATARGDLMAVPQTDEYLE